MTTRTRVAITVASAVALAVTQYGSVASLGDPGLERDIWGWSVLAAYGLAVLGVFFVNRWWALLPALAPMATGLHLEYLTDYTYPWESESIRPSGRLGFLVLPFFSIAFFAAMLSIGLLARRVWDAVMGSAVRGRWACGWRRRRTRSGRSAGRS